MSKVFALSEAALIGIHSMVLIAKSKEQLNAIQISERLSASKHHVAKVLQRLVKDNYLTSQRGPTGGFVLNTKANEITLYDIYTCIEGEIEDSHCMIDVKVCPNEKCIFGKFGNKITNDFRKHLESTSLKEYL